MTPRRTTLQITLMLLAFIGIWLVDISITAINAHMILYNGWHYATPEKMYHVGLYITLFSTWAMAVNLLTTK